MTDRIRLIATDVDGTLLDSRGDLPEENLRAIRLAQRAGIAVVIATGRLPENAWLLMEDYGLHLPVIGANGGRIVDESLRSVAEHYMDPASARAVLETAFSFGAECYLFGERFICSCSRTGLHHSEMSQGDRVRALGFTYFHGWDEARECVKKRVGKFYLRSSVSLAPVRDALAAVSGIELTQSGDYNIEVMPLGVDKGRGIREYATYAGVPLAGVMAVGDENNDAPMLRTAGCGVAMGNASPDARAAARFITKTNDQCGFAEAVKQYALRE